MRFEKQQRQDVRLPVRPVDGTAAEDFGAVPEVLSQVLSHASTHLAAIARLGEDSLQLREDRSFSIALEVDLIPTDLADREAGGGPHAGAISARNQITTRWTTSEDWLSGRPTVS